MKIENRKSVPYSQKLFNLLCLISYFSSGNKVPISFHINTIGISERTVYRYLKLLEDEKLFPGFESQKKSISLTGLDNNNSESIIRWIQQNCNPDKKSRTAKLKRLVLLLLSNIHINPFDEDDMDDFDMFLYKQECDGISVRTQQREKKLVLDVLEKMFQYH